MNSHGPCLKCLGRKIDDTMYPVQFTITYKRPGHVWDHEACCISEYWRIRNMFQRYAEVKLEGE